jgi:F0F1-type ATP synthase membrane subunit b/b'
MQSYIQKEIDSLSNRLNTEQKLRTESLEKVTNEFKVEAKAISEIIERRLKDQQSQDSRDLRQQLLEQSKSFSNEISKKHEESSAALDRSVQQLRADKVDRSTFSELLMEMAVRMSDELGAKLNLESSDLK